MAAEARSFTRIGVVGGGAWGTALALATLRAGRDTLLWAREPAVVEAIRRDRENRDYLPGVPLPAELEATSDLADLAGCDALLLVTPAQHLRSACATPWTRRAPTAPASCS